MGFLAFSLSLVIGLRVGNPFTTLVGKSIVVLFVFYFLGLVLASIGQKVIEQSFEREVEILREERIAENEKISAEEESEELSSDVTPVDEPMPQPAEVS